MSDLLAPPPKPARDERGRLLPGQTANAGGRPKGLERRVRELVDFDKITLALQSIALGELPEGLSEGATVKIRDRIEAAKLLYDRGYGKAKITVDIAADIVSGNISGVDVDALDDNQLDILDAAISQATDPRARARKAKDANAKEPSLLSNLSMLGAQTIDVREPDVAPEPVREPDEVVPAVVQEPEPVPAPPARLVRHVFRGSANVAQAVLNLDTNEVDVVFTSGARYRFADFTEEKLKDWGLAVSAGKWFNVEIKGHPELHPPVGKRM